MKKIFADLDYSLKKGDCHLDLPRGREFHTMDTLIKIRCKEFEIVKSKFPAGTVIAIHDTSDKHPMGKMRIDETTRPQKWIHLPSPRGLSVTIL